MINNRDIESNGWLDRIEQEACNYALEHDLDFETDADWERWLREYRRWKKSESGRSEEAAG